MSLNCDSQDRRVPMHHRLDPHGSDCAPRTRRQSSRSLLLMVLTPGGLHAPQRKPYAGKRVERRDRGSGRWVGKVRGGRSPGDGNSQSPTLNNQKLSADRDTKRMRGMGPPVAAISSTLQERSGQQASRGAEVRS